MNLRESDAAVDRLLCLTPEDVIRIEGLGVRGTSRGDVCPANATGHVPWNHVWCRGYDTGYADAERMVRHHYHALWHRRCAAGYCIAAGFAVLWLIAIMPVLICWWR